MARLACSTRSRIFIKRNLAKTGMINLKSRIVGWVWERRGLKPLCQTSIRKCRVVLFFDEGDRKSDPYEENHRENPKVVNMINGFIHWLVQEFSVDGLRVDTVKHVRKSFWPGFEAAAGVFCTGEVLHGGERVWSFYRYVTLFELLTLAWCEKQNTDPAYTLPYQGSALSSVLNYPIYFPLRCVAWFKPA